MDAIWQRRKVEASVYFEKLLYKLEELEVLYQQTVADAPKAANDLYFNDGIRKIDFIFVYKRSSKQMVKDKVNNYIKNLENEGVQFEVGESNILPALLFIKVHVVRIRLLLCSVLMSYEAAFLRVPDAPIDETHVFNLPCMFTDLTNHRLLSEVVQRASESSLGARPKDLTSAERIMITYELLQNVSFGEKEFEVGVKYLLDHKRLVAAYPLHEQPSGWTRTGSLNDRQLLVRYWAKFSMLFKYQPLDLIYKYYGAEVAFYFAFVGFYIKMLIPMAILGVMAFIYGIVTLDSDKNPFSKKICESKEIFCPACQRGRLCMFEPVVHDCPHSKLHYVLDNNCMIIWSIVMCFWATIVSELWKRKENVLLYKWNLLTIERDTQVLPEYTKYAKHKRFNKHTGKYDYYIPQMKHTLKIFFSAICCALLIALVIVVAIGTILLRLFIVYSTLDSAFANQMELISHVFSIAALFIFMILFDLLYKKVAKMLTDFERPRTQTQYDHSYIIKLHLLSSVNAYTYLYYTAFFKGTFRTHPGDEEQYASLGLLNNDVHIGFGRILPLGLQIALILTAKTLFKMVIEHIVPVYILKLRKKRMEKKLQGVEYKYSSWEMDYLCQKVDYYDIGENEFKTIIIQYGYLIIFPTAFPLGPLLALIANLVEVRLDAAKLSLRSRRPVPRRVHGIGAWKSILRTISYIGIVTNCFYIAFSTSFLYYLKKFFAGTEIDVLKSSFSRFDVSHYHTSSPFYGTTEVKSCLYEGTRFPPDHPQRYQLTKEFWETKCFQLMIVIALEGCVMGFNRLLAFAIPDMPAQIQERINVRRKREHAAREKKLNEKFLAKQSTRQSMTRDQIAARLMRMQPEI